MKYQTFINHFQQNINANFINSCNKNPHHAVSTLHTCGQLLNGTFLCSSHPRRVHRRKFVQIVDIGLEQVALLERRSFQSRESRRKVVNHVLIDVDLTGKVLPILASLVDEKIGKVLRGPDGMGAVRNVLAADPLVEVFLRVKLDTVKG